MTGYCGAKFEPRYGVLDANAESEHNVRAMSQARIRASVTGALAHPGANLQ